MRVLTIGNSFSCDATAYLHEVAAGSGTVLRTVNLNIGGCTPDQHYQHSPDKTDAYALEIDGHASGFAVSLEKALLSGTYDAITLQQGSHKSFDGASYFPYIEKLADYIRLYQPAAKLMIHETWAYEEGSDRLLHTADFDTAEAMYQAVHKAYAKAANAIHADGIIPSGTLFRELVKQGLPVHRDTFHASLNVGRYALALLWTAFLTGADVTSNRYENPDHPVSGEDRQTILRTIKTVLG